MVHCHCCSCLVTFSLCAADAKTLLAMLDLATGGPHCAVKFQSFPFTYEPATYLACLGDGEINATRYRKRVGLNAQLIAISILNPSHSSLASSQKMDLYSSTDHSGGAQQDFLGSSNVLGSILSNATDMGCERQFALCGLLSALHGYSTEGL